MRLHLTPINKGYDLLYAAFIFMSLLNEKAF
jgi:hypothetical protein